MRFGLKPVMPRLPQLRHGEAFQLGLRPVPGAQQQRPDARAAPAPGMTVERPLQLVLPHGSRLLGAVDEGDAASGSVAFPPRCRGQHGPRTAHDRDAAVPHAVARVDERPGQAHARAPDRPPVTPRRSSRRGPAAPSPTTRPRPARSARPRSPPRGGLPTGPSPAAVPPRAGGRPRDGPPATRRSAPGARPGGRSGPPRGLRQRDHACLPQEVLPHGGAHTGVVTAAAADQPPASSLLWIF